MTYDQIKHIMKKYKPKQEGFDSTGRYVLKYKKGFRKCDKIIFYFDQNGIYIDNNHSDKKNKIK